MGFVLPEDLWMRILSSGVDNGQFQYRDLCALSLVSTRFSRLCGLDCMWKKLVAQDFPESAGRDIASTEPQRKPALQGVEGGLRKLYRMRFMKVKQQKMAAHKRAVLRQKSTLKVLQLKTEYCQDILKAERRKLCSALEELKNLDRTCQTSVAFQIWQPHAVTTRHEQLLQQVPIDVAARKNNLWLEVQDCKIRVSCMENSVKSNERAIEVRQQELDYLTSNPFEDPYKNRGVFLKVGEKRKSGINPVSQEKVKYR